METFTLRCVSLLVIVYTVTAQIPEPPSLGADRSGALPTSAFTSSTQFNRLSGASKGRLKLKGNVAAWIPSPQDNDPWIQIDLGEVSDVYSVITQGRADGRAQYTMAYEVSSSVDGITYDFVQEDGGNKRFDGNANKNAPVTNSFDPPLRARYVSLHPTECSAFGCALRLDLLGYPGCKDNFERFYTNCYLHVTTPGNFFEQQAVCMGYGADLASIQTEEENDFIAGITDNVRSWIGGKFDPNTDSFVWVDGSAMSLTKWRKREPNRWGDKEDCVETNFIRRGLWNDHFCVRQKAAVCKLASP